jgi:hypothetical protein
MTKRKKLLWFIFWCAYAIFASEYIWLKDSVLTKILASYFCIEAVGISFNEWRSHEAQELE